MEKEKEAILKPKASSKGQVWAGCWWRGSLGEDVTGMLWWTQAGWHWGRLLPPPLTQASFSPAPVPVFLHRVTERLTRFSTCDAKQRALHLVRTQTDTHFVLFLPIFQMQKKDMSRDEKKLKKEGSWTPQHLAYFSMLPATLMSKLIGKSCGNARCTPVPPVGSPEAALRQGRVGKVPLEQPWQAAQFQHQQLLAACKGWQGESFLCLIRAATTQACF